MVVINDLSSATISQAVESHGTRESTIDSDASTSYVKLKDIVKEHRPQVIPKQEIGKILLWIHIAISTTKRMLLDIYHDTKPDLNILSMRRINFRSIAPIRIGKNLW